MFTNHLYLHIFLGHVFYPLSTEMVFLNHTHTKQYASVSPVFLILFMVSIDDSFQFYVVESVSLFL